MKCCTIITRHAIAVVIVLLLSPWAVFAQGCDQRAIMTSSGDVYESPPRYTTGIGWQGTRIAVLPAKSQVYICTRQSVDFGLSSKAWFRIAYRVDGRWAYGWVLEDYIARWSGLLRDQKNEGVWSWIAQASAGESLNAATAEQATWSLPAAPPPRSDISPPASAIAPNTASWHDLAVLYAPLFVAMLFGMIAKALVDYLDTFDTERTLREHFRNALIAVLVSPIVFLGFLTAGQFSTSTQTFLVLCLLAFQNGFFWQAVLKREGERKPIPVKPLAP